MSQPSQMWLDGYSHQHLAHRHHHARTDDSVSDDISSNILNTKVPDANERAVTAATLDKHGQSSYHREPANALLAKPEYNRGLKQPKFRTQTSPTSWRERSHALREISAHSPSPRTGDPMFINPAPSLSAASSLRIEKDIIHGFDPHGTTQSSAAQPPVPARGIGKMSDLTHISGDVTYGPLKT